MPKVFRSFASDNHAGIHPAVLEAISQANRDHAIAYGEDPFTERAQKKFREIFGECDVYFVFNGTAANVLGIKALTSSFHSIICADTAHIHLDECGAPEKFCGCKLIPIPTENGRLTVERIDPTLARLDDQHHSQPKVISISQTTELGTVYTIKQIRSLADFAHEHALYLHMDGARAANAAASLGVSLRSMTLDAGVDVLSFGGTKNGLMCGEAIVFRDPKISENFKFIRKQGMQLSSKMRFLSVQFEALLTDDLWLKNAQHANHMAKRLELKVKEIPRVKISRPVEANAIFARIPRESISKIQEKYFFYVWDEVQSEVRWMTSFDTTEEDVDRFAMALNEGLK